jgi:hypothetical protein
LDEVFDGWDTEVFDRFDRLPRIRLKPKTAKAITRALASSMAVQSPISKMVTYNTVLIKTLAREGDCFMRFLSFPFVSLDEMI